MRNWFLIFLMVLLFSEQNVNAISPKKMIKVKLPPQIQQSTQDFYKLGLDITSINPLEKTVNVLVSENEIAQLKNSGYTTEVLIDDINRYARELRGSGYLDNFHSNSEILAEMQEIVARHPEIAQLEDIGDSFEKTAKRGGYDIWVLKISDNVQVPENEPEVFYFSNIHAREIITPEIILYFMHSLVDQYGKEPYITYLVNNRQIYLCPTMNPDGLEYVLSGSSPLQSSADPIWWRKNKSDNNKNNKFDPDNDGVDLNRNFGYEWGRDNSGSSPYTSSDLYRGTGPFSESESQAIRDFVIAHKFVVSLAFHSYSQLWLYPWGYAVHKPTPDHAIFVALADSCVAYNQYLAQLAADLYPVNGDTDDWLYGEQELKNKIFAFTPEVGSLGESVGNSTGFFPDTMYIQKQILENQGPMFFLAYAAGELPIIETKPLSDLEDGAGPYQVKATIKPPLVLTKSVNLDVASFKVFYNTTGVAPFDSILLNATGNANEFAAAIPGQGSRKTVYYYLAARDMSGRTGFAPRPAPQQLYSFTIRPDTIPPAIAHSPLQNQSIYFSILNFKAKVEDKAGIESVRLYYRQNKSQIDSLEMKAEIGSNEYQGQISPAQMKAGDLFEYRILAIDKSHSGNRIYVPATGFYRFYIVPGLLFDFEADNANFKATRGKDWNWGRPTSGPGAAHSGINVWATNLSGNYQNNADSYLDSPPINLANMSQVWLSFWHWYEFEYNQNALWDGGNVKISADGGAFEIIKPIDGYDGYIDPYNAYLKNQPALGGPVKNGNFWHQDYFDLSAYANKSIIFRFHIGSDDNTSASGWYIDDVQIFMSPSNPPVITNTKDLGSTNDVVGPYSIQTTIKDDKGISAADLLYSSDGGKNFQTLPMRTVNDSLYQAEIPGQSFGTLMDYYIRAIDTDNQLTTDPLDAPSRSYHFLVTDKLPIIKTISEQANFILKKNEKVEDHFGITNQGKMNLSFMIRDSLLNSSHQSFQKTQLSHPFSANLSDSSNKRGSLLSKIAFEQGVPWIFFSPQSGNLGENDSVRINFTIDAELANPGDYHVLFSIQSNDPIRPIVEIRLSISILPGTLTENDPTAMMPSTFYLEQNFPNPFNPSTLIRFYVPVASNVKISIANIQGQAVVILFEGQKTSGFHTLQWNGCDAAGQRVTNGIYLLSLKAEKFSQVRKMILLQ